MANGVIDEALDRLSTTGPEFGSGLSNHGPMAAEALVALGREDAVMPWAEWYARRLQDRPQTRNRIEQSHWHEALGEIGRVGDWEEFFRGEVQERSLNDVLETWVRRLTPGIMAGATHGVIRTAHAVRSLDRGTNPQRLSELAEGLAYWAARYQELPTRRTAGQSPPLTIAAALDEVPLIDPASRTRGLIFDAVKAADPSAFAPAIDYVSVDAGSEQFLTDLTRVFVRQYLANAATASISFIHCVTAPSAIRMLAPHVTAETARDAMRYAWQACAAIYSAYGASGSTASDRPVPSHAVDVDDLIDRAVATRDEHAIKFTEACLREHRISGDSAFVTAAADAVSRLGRP